MTDIRIATITGHRPPKLGQSWDGDEWIDRLIRHDIAATLDLLDVTNLITGMALGIDMLAAEAAQVMGIPYTAAIPFPGQELRWSETSQTRYNRLLDDAHKVIQVGETYSREAFQTRNEWMVDRCDFVIAYWDGSAGGTANCIKYALDKRSVWSATHQMWLSRHDPLEHDEEE